MKNTFRHLITLVLCLLLTVTSWSQSISSLSAVHTFCVCATGLATLNTTACDSFQVAEISWGDGSVDTTPITCSVSGSGSSSTIHFYSATGTYTVRAVLIDSGARVDSVSTSLVMTYCTDVYFEPFLDANSNCAIDSAEGSVLGSYTIAIDSAGFPVDTINMYGYGTYRIFGPLGTVYSFTVLSVPYSYTVGCILPVFYDTVQASTGMYTTNTHRIPIVCASGIPFDLEISANFRAALTGSGANKANIFATNQASCTPTAGTITFQFSPKYTFFDIFPVVSHTVSGTSVSFDAGAFSPGQTKHFSVRLTPVVPLVLGDTVNSLFTISPVIGDGTPTNNIKLRCDTVVASYDPNAKSVYPTGHISPGTRLEYLVQFENTGNAPAVNIHVLDTLSNLVDPSTVVVHGATHKMNLIRYVAGGNAILKFDFPNIMLPDSSDHEGCKGSLIYSVTAKSSLSPGSAVTNRAGIYFDYNEVVLTNTTYSLYPLPTSIADIDALPVGIYPNPVKQTLSVDAHTTGYSSVTIYDLVGRTLISDTLFAGKSSINVESLVPGSYYVVISGISGRKALKFVKE